MSSRTLRPTVALLATIASLSCSSPSEPPVGAVRVRSHIEHASVYVDATERGPLRDGMVIELTSGVHVLEARSADRVVARAQTEVRSERILDVELAAVETPEATPVPAPSPAPAMPPPPIEPAGEPSTAGTLSADDVGRVVMQERDGAQQCFVRWAAGRSEASSVRVNAELTIEPDGSVSRAVVQGGGDEHASLRACMEADMRAWRFPPASSSTAVSVPFVFSSAEGDDTSASMRDAPNRQDVLAAMRAAEPVIRACGDGQQRVVPVHVTFDSSGRVSSAEAQGVLSATMRTCIARALDGARVPSFSQPSFSVNYPFRI